MTKNILIYANKKNESQTIKKRLVSLISDYDLKIIDETETPDFIISIGGDGTLLSTFHRYQEYLNVAKFIGIHTGHLGFYTDWRHYELEEVVHGLVNSEGESISYPLIEIEIELKSGDKKRFLALNEFSIRSQEGTMVMEIYIKDYFFETFRGDGISVSTPTGSTGLNKSLGGAVMHPRVDAMQLTEMASINNRVYRTLSSPMIIPKDEWVILKPEMNEWSAIVQIDNGSYNDLNINAVRIQIAPERIHFASFRHTHFWDRVENAFIGRKNFDDRPDDIKW